MKHIIDIPNSDVSRWIAETPLGKKLYIPISVEDGKEYSIATEIYAEAYTDPDRKDIEDEVWKFAKKIVSSNGLTKHELDECFGHTTIQGVMTTYDTYQEAKEKYEAWRKQKDEIRVGDEVIDKDVGKAIVTYIDFELCNTLWLDGSVSEDVPLKDLHKTGRHFDEVEELLKKMKEQ